jgi:hypothetical protein
MTVTARSSRRNAFAMARTSSVVRARMRSWTMRWWVAGRPKSRSIAAWRAIERQQGQADEGGVQGAD